MASQKLQQLIALKRAHPYDPAQSIAVLRGSGPDGGRIPRTNTTVTPADADGVYGEWVSYQKPTRRFVFMFLHGGAYFRSSATATRLLASNLSAHCDCRCFTVDYRLAPENPFPAAVDDAHTTYRWLQHQGIPAQEIIIGGSSAGGGLAAALLNRLQRASEPLPAAAVLLSPWTDLTQSATTLVTNAETDPVISKNYLDRAAAGYLGGADPTDPLASPVFGNLAGLPPLLIQVGKPETMYGDAWAYAQKAKTAGVDITFEAYDDVIHGWHNSAHLVPDIPETQTALQQIGAFTRRHQPAPK